MKYFNLLVLAALPVLASCAAKTPAPTVTAPAVAATVPVALSGGLRVTPLATTPAEIAAHGNGVWKFKVETPPSNQRVICEIDLLRDGRVVERIVRMGDLVRATKSINETLVSVERPYAPAGAPAKIVVNVTSGGSGGTWTVNDSFVGGLSAGGWQSVAEPQKDGSFLLFGANHQGSYNVVDASKNELNLVCRFRLNNAPFGKLASAPAPIPFQLVPDKVEFQRASADGARQGFAYQAKIAVGYRGPRPDWWGHDAGVNWNYDSGLALADGKGDFRRVLTSNGTLSTGGSEPYYDSNSDKYVNSAIIAYSEMKGRAGKLVFVQEMLATKKPTGALYQKISAEQFVTRRQNALAKVKIRAVVPPL